MSLYNYNVATPMLTIVKKTRILIEITKIIKKNKLNKQKQALFER
jgi:hypothetical protein